MRFIGPLLMLAACALAQGSAKQLATIEFFGHKGLDTAAIRQALPVHEGDPFPGKRGDREWSRLVEASVTKSIGMPPTDVRFVCCTQEGNFTLYIGLPGATFSPVAFKPVPTGKTSLPKKLVQLYERAGKAGYEAIMSGKSAEDRIQGYSLFVEPKARASQLVFRDEVLRNEESVFQVLANSSNHEQRAIAAEALGYARHTDRQLNAMVQASLDPDDGVRNNATRALGVLVTAFPEAGLKIPLEPYVALMSSGSWADHNKASFLLERLTAARSPELLEKIRNSPARDSLIEMAQWRNAGHAYFAILALGRIGGMEEQVLEQPLTPQQLERIIRSVH